MGHCSVQFSTIHPRRSGLLPHKQMKSQSLRNLEERHTFPDPTKAVHIVPVLEPEGVVMEARVDGVSSAVSFAEGG